MKKADSWFPSEEKPDKHDHSDKFCCCGCHNHKNVKKNKHHHGTQQRLLYRLTRRFRAAEESDTMNMRCDHG